MKKSISQIAFSSSKSQVQLSKVNILCHWKFQCHQKNCIKKNWVNADVQHNLNWNWTQSIPSRWLTCKLLKCIRYFLPGCDWKQITVIYSILKLPPSHSKMVALRHYKIDRRNYFVSGHIHSSWQRVMISAKLKLLFWIVVLRDIISWKL